MRLNNITSDKVKNILALPTRPKSIVHISYTLCEGQVVENNRSRQNLTTIKMHFGSMNSRMTGSCEGNLIHFNVLPSNVK